MDSDLVVACNKENIHIVGLISCFHVFDTDALNFTNTYL